MKLFLSQIIKYAYNISTHDTCISETLSGAGNSIVYLAN